MKTKSFQRSGIPRGSTGWPFIGETLDFIACGYSSTPVSFMDKRKALSVLFSSFSSSPNNYDLCIPLSPFLFFPFSDADWVV